MPDNPSLPAASAAEPRPLDHPARALPLSSAAERALAEAAERRRRHAAHVPAPETGGRTGPEPVRYGDWEKNGIISDF